jgi:hypothetical protein
MSDLFKYIIKCDQTIKDALIALNRLSDNALTLFVVDHEECMLGTLTDGDIRRALIGGCDLGASVVQVMNSNFHSVQVDSLCVEYIRELRKKGFALLPLLTRDKKIQTVYDLKKKRSILPLDAVLMAGGKGERLRPLTEKTPKPLLPVGDKCIIDYNVDHLIEYGVENINVTINYLGEQIEEHFAKDREGIQICCVREPRYLGTMGSIKFVDRFHNDTVLVMNSDLFTNIDFEDFYLHFKKNNADMSVAAVPYSISVPYGIFELEEEREIKGIREKPTYNYYANSGIYLIKRQLLNLIPDGLFFNATDLIEKLVREKYRVIRFPLMGYWIDIGKHEDYKKAQDFVKHL